MAVHPNKRTVRVGTKKSTSIYLKDPEWNALRAAAKRRGRSMAQLLGDLTGRDPTKDTQTIVNAFLKEQEEPNDH